MINLTNKIKKVGIGLGLFILPFVPLKAQEKLLTDAAIGKIFSFYSSNSILKEQTFMDGIVGGIYLSNTKARGGYFFEYETARLEMNKPQKVHMVILKTGLEYNYFLNRMGKIKGYIGAEASYNELAYMDERRHEMWGVAVTPKVGADIPLLKNTKIKLTLEGKVEMLKLRQYSKKHPDKNTKMKHISISGKLRF